MKKTTKSVRYDKNSFPPSKFKTKMIGNVRHMICENSEPGGKYWNNHICEEWCPIGHETVSVLCSRCILQTTDPVYEKGPQPKSDKPKGWKFMKQYVSEDGTVYHKGIVQPELKGKFNPTVIELKPEKVKISKKEKEELINSLGTDINALKASLFSELKKGKRAELTRELSRKNRQLKKLV